ncbi:MAG: hypothetical protein LUG98_03850 [Tannerellaceae bacterium]|nr:hypothetical protein [Tannerellaceae bacterium]
MKTTTIVETYNILKETSITGLTFAGQRVILKAIRSMKSIFDGYVESLKEAQEKLKPEGLEEAQEKANRHNEAVQAGTLEGRLEAGEFKQVSALLTTYHSNLNSYAEELGEEEQDVQTGHLSEEDFEKLIAANEKTEAGKLALLDEILCA